MASQLVYGHADSEGFSSIIFLLYADCFTQLTLCSLLINLTDESRLHNGDRKHRPIATKRTLSALQTRFNLNFFIRASAAYQSSIETCRLLLVTEMQRGRFEWLSDTLQGIILIRRSKVVRVNSNVWLKRRARDECQGEARRRPKRPRVSLTRRGAGCVRGGRPTRICTLRFNLHWRSNILVLVANLTVSPFHSRVFFFQFVIDLHKCYLFVANKKSVCND